MSKRKFDRFFNSPFDYRGQFLVEAAVGREANNQVMSISVQYFPLGRVDIYFNQSAEAASATNEAKREASLS